MFSVHFQYSFLTCISSIIIFIIIIKRADGTNYSLTTRSYRLFILENPIDGNRCSHMTLASLAWEKTSTLCKNETGTDITLNLIYLAKLHENILEHYGFDSLKEIPTGFNNDLQMTSKSPACHPDGLLCSIDK